MRVSTTALAGALGATVLAAGLVHLWRRKVISARMFRRGPITRKPSQDPP